MAGSTELESDVNRVPARTVEILASCHALVFVDNKLVSLNTFSSPSPFPSPDFFLIALFSFVEKELRKKKASSQKLE